MKILKPITLNDTSTFTRASTASYFDSGGLLRVANNNVLRLDYDPSLAEGEGTFLVESAATNLLTYPRDFNNAAWAKNSITVTPNAGIAPDGTRAADLLTATGVDGHLPQGFSGAVAGNTYTGSVWLRADAATTINIYVTNTGVGGNTLKTCNVTATWQRFDVTHTVAAGATGVSLQIGGANSFSTGEAVYAWHGQLEQGEFATSAIPDPTTFTSRASSGTFIGSNGLIQTAGTNVARMQYNPLNLSADPFLLLEAAATNLLLRSEEFDNAAWVKTNTTVTANSTVAPDGVTSMDMLDGTVGSAVAAQSASIPAGTTTPYTASIFLKQGTAAQTSLDMVFFTGGTANTAKVTITWATTSIATSGAASGISARMMSLGNGIYRFEVTGANSGGNNSALQFAFYPSHIGTGTVYAWGAQLEAGSFATSYIATTTATVTRAADISTSPQATRAADVLGTMNSIMTNNVPETENTAWSASTVYKLGDIVRYVAPNIHKLYQSLTGSQATVTMTIAAPCVVTWTGHGHAADTPIVFSTTGALPTGITAGTVYYILAPTANTFNIAATPGGAAINTTGTQSGVHTATASNNFNKNPTTNPTIWQDIGSTNTWKMFDQSVQSQTSQLSNIRVDILLNNSLANTVTLLNIATKTARVTMKHPVDGLVYDQEKTIRSYFGVTDWYQYFYHSFQKDTDLLFEGIPPYPNATLTIDLNDSGNTVKCGVAVIGNAIDTSADKKGVEHGARIGIQDYSVKSQDGFGNYTIVERNFARRTDFTVYTEPEEMNGLVNLLASLRATPTVYIASGENKHTCMITYGFYKDFTVEVAYPTYSICTIQLEGLT